MTAAKEQRHLKRVCCSHGGKQRRAGVRQSPRAIMLARGGVRPGWRRKKGFYSSYLSRVLVWFLVLRIWSLVKPPASAGPLSRIGDDLLLQHEGLDYDYAMARVSKNAILGPNSLTGFWIQDVKAVSLMPGGPAFSRQ
jgi:hypothetical protein